MTRCLRLSALAIALFLAVPVSWTTHNAGGLQAQELTDRQILVNLYNATDGPNWEDDGNWNTAADLSSWFGVNTDDEGRVTGLGLFGNQLSGEIPPELDQLTNLEFLDLRDNQLSGEIPSELGDLTSLIALNLSNNQLTGGIPPELGNLDNLYWLYLYNNQLSGEIPPELGDLDSLHYLDLSNNELSGEIPSELGDLSRLRQLFLYGNQLTGEIPDLNTLQRLTHLSLGANNLEISWATFESGGPIDLASESRWNDPSKDRSMWVLFLHENGLTGDIPDWIGTNHTDLRSLWLHDNALTGDVPTNFVNLTALRNLQMHDNILTEGWQTLDKLTALENLTLPADLFVNEGRTLRIAGDLPVLLKLNLPSDADPMQTHVRWFRNLDSSDYPHLPQHVRMAGMIGIVRDSAVDFVIELRDNQDRTIDDPQHISVDICIPVSSTRADEDLPLLMYDGDDWTALTPVDPPVEFGPGPDNVAACGTTREPTPPRTGGTAPSTNALLILVIFGAATTLAGVSIAKAFKKRLST